MKQKLSLSPNAMVSYHTDFIKWYLYNKIAFGFRSSLILFHTPRKLYYSLYLICKPQMSGLRQILCHVVHNLHFMFPL